MTQDVKLKIMLILIKPFDGMYVVQEVRILEVGDIYIRRHILCTNVCK